MVMPIWTRMENSGFRSCQASFVIGKSEITHSLQLVLTIEILTK